MILKTYVGRVIDFTNIDPNNIHINDIAWALPRLNRFVGHSSRAYSVGEHTILCYLMAEKLGYSTREKLLTFIHDFTEAYCNDCPAPLKKLMPAFEKYEKDIELAIYKHFNIKPPTREEYEKVKRVDLTMLVIEMRDLTLHDPREYMNRYTYYDILYDDDFKLNPHITKDEAELRADLKMLFNNLYKEYKEEYVDGRND